MVARGPAGAASSRSFRLRAKTLIASISAFSRRPVISSVSRCMKTFTRQAQRTVSASHLSAARPWLLMPKRAAMRPSHGLCGASHFGFSSSRIEAQRDIQDFFAAAAEQGQRAVRGNGADGFGIVEIVGELFAGVLLAVDHLRFHHAVFAQVFAQRLQQGGVFGEALHQDLARAVERRLGIGHAGVVAVVGGECRLQVLDRLLLPDSASGSASKASASSVRPASAAICALVRRFGLYGRYRSSSRVLSSAWRDGVAQFRRHLALFLDRGQDRRAPLFQFAQIAQAFFQQAQLDVVQPAGRFLAVAGDEGHGGAFVQQGDGGGDLGRFGGEFKGETLFDGRQHG